MGRHDRPEHLFVPFLIFIDFDGVVVDYDLGAKQHNKENKPWEAKNIPGFFLNLKPLGNSIEYVLKLEKEFPGQVRFLTSASYSRPESWTEKVIWYNKHFPTLHKRLIITSDKGACGSYNDILIDDHPDWNGADRFKGRIFHFKSPKDWEKVISFCKEK